MPKITLKASRVNANLTQSDVAKHLHRTKQTIVNWESGATEIRYSDMLQLSELYGMPLDFLAVPLRKSEKS